MICIFLTPGYVVGLQGGGPGGLKGWLPDGPQEDCYKIACEMGPYVGETIEASFGGLGWGEHAVAGLRRRGCGAV